MQRDTISLTVTFANQSRIVEANPNWNILFLKQLCATLFHLPTQNVQQLGALVGGKLLPDMLHLRQMNATSPLSAIRFILVTPQQREPLQHADVDDEVHDTDSIATARFRFHVWCRTCPPVGEGSVQRAKLRVLCAQCHQQTFWCTEEPSNFTNSSGKGTCYYHLQESTSSSSTCPGTACLLRLECMHQTSHDRPHDTFPLWLVTENFFQIPCLACLEVSPRIFKYPCSHALCLGCFMRYCESNLELGGRFALHPEHSFTLDCPAGCPDSHIPDPHYFKMCGPQFYSRFKDRAAEVSAMEAGAVYCPNPRCGQVWIPDPEDATGDAPKRLECPVQDNGEGCGLVFCSVCKQPYHGETVCSAAVVAPSTSSSTERWRLYEDIASRQCIEKLTKPCPGCGVATERNRGCMHMTCARCGCEWCWLCGVRWKAECQNTHWFE